MKTFFSLFLIALGVGLFFLYTDPQYQNIKQLQIESADYNQALNQSKVLLAQRQALNDQYDKIPQADLDRIGKLVPDSVDNVRLVIDINGIAAKRGLNIKGIRIQGGSTATGPSTTLGPDNNPFGSLSLAFTVTAPYDQFKGFLQDLEQSLRMVDVTALSFAASDKTADYDYSISLKTYWLKQ
jgi:Tfp pilus assembly protein PilO